MHESDASSAGMEFAKILGGERWVGAGEREQL